MTIEREQWTSAHDPMLWATFGDLATASTFRRFGQNDDVDTTTLPEDVWRTGGVISHPTSAAVVSVVSGSANDAAAGTGAQTVSVQFLNADYEVTNETLTLNGTSAVTTEATAIRFIRAAVLTAGSGAENAGALTFSIGGNTQATIPAGVNQTLITHYTVPANSTAALTALFVSQTGGASNSKVEFQQRPNGGVWRPVTTVDLDGTAITAIHVPIRGVTFSEKTDLRVQVTSVSLNNIDFSASYELLLRTDA